MRERRRALGTRWRRLSADRQALLALAHLRNGQPYAQLAAGFGIGTTTVYRYVTEAVELLAALAPTLAEAVQAASIKAYLILDGTLLPIDRIAADRPFYSGNHKKHGMNVQVIADPKGRLLWASPALAGAVLDARAARQGRHHRRSHRGWHQLLGGQGVPGRRISVRAPLPRPKGQPLHRSHTKVRALVEQAIASLKSWLLLRKLRCSTTRITSLVQAVLTLHLASGRLRPRLRSAVES
ncbi:transposase family protein [Streptomyces olivochromogenes]|uniref:transposase family protein n=1 Tax=Streptomyces olivochromogenes TaxID=1963 RepID=UPI001F2488A9|nr:transposase family protein [Streptomyces olivochromogenes]